MTLEDYLADQGFEIVQRSREGANRYVLRRSSYLQVWVTWFQDGTIEFTWEFELGAYLLMKGFTISVQDELSLLLFPGAEKRGPADANWLAGEILRMETELGSIDALTGN